MCDKCIHQMVKNSLCSEPTVLEGLAEWRAKRVRFWYKAIGWVLSVWILVELWVLYKVLRSF